MYYDLTQPLRDHRNEPITELNAEGEPAVVTLGVALERACIGGGSPHDDLDAKVRQYKLAQKMASFPDQQRVDLSAEDVSLLKQLAAQVYSAIGAGAVAEALERPVAANDDDAA